MTISSRTPEGWDNECPQCRRSVVIQPSQRWRNAPLRDATCPHCGGLVVWREDELASDPEELRHVLNRLSESQNQPDFDSLDTVEMIMELEESGAKFPPDAAADN